MIARTLAAISVAGWMVLCAGCASKLERDTARYQRQLPALLTALRARDDADSLAAAALLQPPAKTDDVLLLIQQAVAKAPDRADLLWLNTSMCMQVENCDPWPLELRLRELDPANGAGWLGAVARAWKAKQEDSLLLALQSLGRTERVDLYWFPLIRHLGVAVGHTEAWPLSNSVLAVTGSLAARAIPAYQSVSKACRDEHLEKEYMVNACRGAARALTRGDTFITMMIGLRITERAWPADSPEARAATEARRIYHYRAELISKLELQMNWNDERYWETYLQKLAGYRTEQDYYLSQIVQAGENPQPPADWIDPRD